MSRIDDLKKLNKNPLDSDVTVDDLFLRDENGKTYLDYIVHNKRYLLNLEMINEIFSDNENVQKLLQLDFYKYIINKVYDAETLYKCFLEINRLDLLGYANEYALLSRISTGNLLIEEMLKRGIKLNNEDERIRDEKIIQILFANKRYNEILSIDLFVLLNKPDKENNYLKMLIQKYHEKEKIDFNLINNNSYQLNTDRNQALYYIECLKNGIPIDLQFLKNNQIISNITRIDQNFGYKLIEKIYIKKNIIKRLRMSISPNYEQYLNNMPNLNEFISKLDNNEITEVKNTDILFMDLLTPYKDSTILDYLLKNNIDISCFDYAFMSNTDMDIIQILVNNKYNYNFLNAKSLLFESISENQKLIDLLVLNGYKEIVSDDMRIIFYAIKYHNFNMISPSLFGELLYERNGQFKIEEYLNNEEFLEYFTENCDSLKLIKLYEKGYKNVLSNSSEKILLANYKGTTVLENLLKSGINPTFSWYKFKSKEVMDLLIKYERYDLLGRADINLLMDEPSKENNYLSFVINCIKKGINTDLQTMTDSFHYIIGDKELIARFYIQMAQNNLERYLPPLEVHYLLGRGNDNHNLLYHLLQIDKDLTVNKLLNESLKANWEILAQLIKYGATQKNPSSIAKFYYPELENMYLGMYNRAYLYGTQTTDESLINELYELFVSDGQSDMEILETLITSYRYNLRVNPAIKDEIIKLIEVKKEHPNFCYKKALGGKEGYFNSFKNEVAVSKPLISIVNHETGHALHFYTTNEALPDNFAEVIARVTSSADWSKKVLEFFQKYQEVHEEAALQSQRFADIHFRGQDSAQEIFQTFTENKEVVKKEFLAVGYSEEVLNIILAQNITLEEVQNTIREIELGELTSVIMYAQYSNYMAIADIIDSLCDGKLFDISIEEAQDETAYSIAGHGVRYYSEYKLKFAEIMANYSEIIKSKYAEEGIEYLRYIVGDEFVDLIDDFYNEQILGKEKINNQSL